MNSMFMCQLEFCIGSCSNVLKRTVTKNTRECVDKASKLCQMRWTQWIARVVSKDVSWHIDTPLLTHWIHRSNLLKHRYEVRTTRQLISRFPPYQCKSYNDILGVLYQHGLIWIPPPISNYIHYNTWYEITYPFPNFHGTAVEVWEWIDNFVPHVTVHVIAYTFQEKEPWKQGFYSINAKVFYPQIAEGRGPRVMGLEFFDRFIIQHTSRLYR